jgi:hypothetical protein
MRWSDVTIGGDSFWGKKPTIGRLNVITFDILDIDRRILRMGLSLECRIDINKKHIMLIFKIRG